MRTRVLIALAVAVVAAGVAFVSMAGAGGVAKDLTIPWNAAHALLAGRDPYAITTTQDYPSGIRFMYPLPAALLSIPFAWLPARIAGVLFVAISFGILAWTLARDATHRLLLVASFPALMAATLGQWSPLLLAATLVPALQFAAAAKPTVGIASMFYRRSPLGLALVAALVAVSFVVMPHWFTGWRAAAAAGAHSYLPPIVWARGAGALLLIGALRWRDRDARHIVLLACLPQMPLFYDQLLLGAVARTRGEVWWLVAMGWIGGLAWAFQPSPGQGFERPARGLILAFLYLPALLLVLRRRRTPEPAS